MGGVLFCFFNTWVFDARIDTIAALEIILQNNR